MCSINVAQCEVGAAQVVGGLPYSVQVSVCEPYIPYLPYLSNETSHSNDLWCKR